MARLLDLVSLIPRFFLVALMVVLLVDMMLGVFFRYVMEQPLPWTEEVGNLALIWLMFIGGAVGITRGSHFSIHLLEEHVSLRTCLILKRAVAIIILCFALVLVPTCWRLLLASSSSEMPGLGISVGYQYASAFVGSLLFVCYGGALAVGAFRGTDGSRHRD
jgi:TRAP-type C4-dicarboxylate transport system permease small subunit